MKFPDSTAMLEYIVSGIVFSIIGYYIPLLLDLIKFKKAIDFSGEWISIWQSKSNNEPEWVKEKLIFKQTLSGVSFNNEGNDCNYSYKGTAKLHAENYIVGTWESSEKRAITSGPLFFIISPGGKSLVGSWGGPNDEGTIITGAIIVGKDKQDIKFGLDILKFNSAEIIKVLDI